MAKKRRRPRDVSIADHTRGMSVGMPKVGFEPTNTQLMLAHVFPAS